jgi:hypothetical protein
VVLQRTLRFIIRTTCEDLEERELEEREVEEREVEERGREGGEIHSVEGKQSAKEFSLELPFLMKIKLPLRETNFKDDKRNWSFIKVVGESL